MEEETPKVPQIDIEDLSISAYSEESSATSNAEDVELHTENIEVIERDEEADQDQVRVATEGSIESVPQEKEIELTIENLEEIERERKRKRREARKKTQDLFDKHFRKPTVAFKEEPIETKYEAEKNSSKSDNRPSQLRVFKSVTSDLTSGQARLSGVLSIERLDELDTESTEENDSDDDVDVDDVDDAELKKNPLTFNDDIMVHFVMPTLSDISSDLSISPLSSRKTTLETLEGADVIAATAVKDKGKFVDPLAVECISEEQEISEEQGESILDIVDDATPSSSWSSSSSSEWAYFEDLLPEPEAPPPEPKIEDVIMELFPELRPVEVDQGPRPSVTFRLAREENSKIVHNFIQKLIKEVVATSEYVDPRELLRRRLDKAQLFVELEKLTKTMLSEQQYNSDLMTKIREYSQRSGKMRNFEKLSTLDEHREQRRYADALKFLDFQKKSVEATKRNLREVLTNVTMDLNFTHNITGRSEDSLEECLRRVLIQKGAENLPRVVENELRRMKNVRDEISDTRLELIGRQHVLANIVERMDNFNQITKDLTMDMFLMTQTEVGVLGKKVEERESDLKRMRNSYVHYMHQLAFIREKSSIIQSTLNQRKLQLKDNLNTVVKLREQLNQLKIQRAKLKSQKNELLDQCGLLHKPALLYDYDATVDHIKLKTETVKKLRDKVKDLEARITYYNQAPRVSRTSLTLQGSKPNQNQNLDSFNIIIKNIEI